MIVRWEATRLDAQPILIVKLMWPGLVEAFYTDDLIVWRQIKTTRASGWR